VNAIVRTVGLAAVTVTAMSCLPRPITIEAGSRAPAITLTGATRDGVLSEPIRLRDFRGQTVILAFFYKARTPG
jgi:peroxiredoxin Q/BCP